MSAKKNRLKLSAYSLAVAVFIAFIAPLSVSAEVPATDPLCQMLLTKIKGKVFPKKTAALQSQNAKQVLKRIAGRVRIDTPQDSRARGEFFTDLDLVTRHQSGNGEALINVLENHVNKNSPTTLRVEEKAVIHESSLSDFFTKTQSVEFAQSYNNSQLVKWAARDVPRGGHRFATITEYGRHLVFEWPKSEGTFIIKPRFRKYFEFPETESKNIQNYRPVMNDLTALELKITVNSGNSDGSFLSTENTVFKPRLLVNDEVAESLKSISFSGTEGEQQLTALRDKVLELKNIDGQPLNNAEQVQSFFTALAMLISIDSQFLKPEFAVQYERSSYRLRTQGREYQLTADRNIKIFKPSQAAAGNQLQQYLSEIPIYNSPEEEIFIELKSPLADKKNSHPFYTQTIQIMESGHLVNYKMGSGKYAIARYVDVGLQDQNMDRTLIEKGTKYWLIKGTSQMDAMPKKNDFLTQGEIEVAIPFTTKEGKVFRAVFRYKSTKQFDAQPRVGVLEKVKIQDDFGMDIKIQNGFEKLIWSANSRTQDEVLGLEIDGQIIPFKTRLTSKEISEYNDFFMRYYSYQTDMRGRARNLESIDRVSGPLGLYWYTFKLKSENLLHFIIDRTKRVSMGAILTVAAIAAYDHVRTDLATATPPPTAITTTAPPLVLEGLRHSKDGEVKLLAHADGQGGYYFTLAEREQLALTANSNLVLLDSEGKALKFITRIDQSGNIYLTLSGNL